MHVPDRRDWALPDRDATPEPESIGRRDFLRRVGLAGAGIAAAGVLERAARAVADRGGAAAAPHAGTVRAERTGTAPSPTAPGAPAPHHFYEFTEDPRRVAELSADFATRPWRLRVDGLVQRPRTLDLDDLRRHMPREERVYRHRCVEPWSMVVPWSGFPLARLVEWARPLASARYLRVVSFDRPDEAPNQRRASWYPWPYAEALRLDEAVNELAFVATGRYGRELPTAHGAPLRIVLPWKYGLKSAKSVVRFEFTAERPRTFWTHHAPEEYGFLSNVNPAVPHPRWSQRTERPIGTLDARPTEPYNGYGPWVARLYDAASETFRS